MAAASSRAWSVPALACLVAIALLSVWSFGIAGAQAVAPGEAPALTVTRLEDGLWLHTSYRRFGDTVVVSHGLIVEGEDQAILVDTGWSDADNDVLFAWIDEELGKPVSDLIVTHAHADRMSGADRAMDAGARLHAHTLTAAAASAAGLPVIPGNFDERLTVAIDGAAVEAFYPGPGHTADNVVVQVLGTDLLFGGCMIRPLESGSAGNTADADLAAWPGSVARTAEAYPHVRRVIPSHGAPAGRELFDHTIAVVSVAQ